MESVVFALLRRLRTFSPYFSTMYDFVNYFYYICIPSCSPCKGNTLIIRLLPLHGGWRCGVVMFTLGAALGYVIIGFSARL